MCPPLLPFTPPVSAAYVTCLGLCNAATFMHPISKPAA
eukprot:jgi/Mesvir1/24735/Mv26008-RA.1